MNIFMNESLFCNVVAIENITQREMILRSTLKRYRIDIETVKSMGGAYDISCLIYKIYNKSRRVSAVFFQSNSFRDSKAV